jgi:hypothetical protein
MKKSIIFSAMGVMFLFTSCAKSNNNVSRETFAGDNLAAKSADQKTVGFDPSDTTKGGTSGGHITNTTHTPPPTISDISIDDTVTFNFSFIKNTQDLEFTISTNKHFSKTVKVPILKKDIDSLDARDVIEVCSLDNGRVFVGASCKQQKSHLQLKDINTRIYFNGVSKSDRMWAGSAEVHNTKKLKITKSGETYKLQ